MPDSQQAQELLFTTNLSQEQLSVLLLETRNDVREIKEILRPLSDWKSRVQGGMMAIIFVITLLSGVLGWVAVQWSGSRESIIKIEAKLEAHDGKVTVVENQLETAKAATDTANARLNSLENTVKDYNKDLADLKARLSALETGAITNHIRK